MAYIGRLDSKKNKRSELERKCWPDIYISNLQVKQTPATKKLYLYKVHRNVEFSNKIGYLSKIDIDGIKWNDIAVEMYICNEPIRIPIEIVNLKIY